MPGHSYLFPIPPEICLGEETNREMKWRGPFSLGTEEARREGGWTRGSDWRGGREALLCINSRMRSFVLGRFPVQGREKMPGVLLSRPIEVLLVPRLFL